MNIPCPRRAAAHAAPLVLVAMCTYVQSQQPPATDYGRLMLPAVAEQLELTDEQRVNIARLLEERAAVMAKGATAERDAELTKNNDALRDLLSDVQREKLAGISGQQKIRFSFDREAWPEVLGWFARQAGLSLVLDKAPPDTFTFRDTKAYTPAEAIDLVNSVLITKGFTLIRRGSLLLCVDISTGAPAALIPRVRLEELDNYGTFELVSVLFPLGKRPAQAVHEEVQPLLGPYGRSIALPQTGQLLVTETAGKMRSISAIIGSIAEPAPPAAPSQVPAPAPVLTVYPVKKIDPVAVVEILRQLVKDATFSADAKAGQISAYALPAQHASIKTAIDQMEANDQASGAPYLQPYVIDEIDLSQAQAQIQIAASGARVTIDPANKRVLVFADAKEHEKVKGILAALAPEGSTERPTDRRIEVYSLKKVDPAVIVGVLQATMPRVKATAEPSARRVIVQATSADHQLIAQLIQQMEPAANDPRQPVLEFYPVPDPSPPDLVATLRAVVSAAKIEALDEGRQLRVVASPEDQQLVKQTMERAIAAHTPPEKRQLRIYSVTRAQLKRFQAVRGTLGKELADIQVVEDAQLGEMAISARPAQHEQLVALLDSLATESPTDKKQQLVAYALARGDVKSVHAVVKELFPDARIVVEEKSSQLVIWARPEDHQVIKTVVEQLDAPPRPGTERKLLSYPAGGGDAQVMLPLLQQLVPEMTLTLDGRANAIVGWGVEQDHQRLATALDRLRDGDPRQKRTMLAYPTGHRDPEELRRILEGVVPGARLAHDATTRQITAWANAEEHAMIGDSLKLLTTAIDESDSRLQVYSVPRTGAVNAIQALRRAVPSAQLTAGASTDQLIAWGNSAAHETLQAAVQQMETEDATTQGLSLKSYRARKDVIARASEFVRSSLTTVRVVPSADPQTLLVWGRTPDQDTVRKVIDSLEAESRSDDRQLHVYRLPLAIRRAARSMLSTALPDITYLDSADPNQMIVWAKPAQHQEIAKILAEIQRTVTADEEKALEVYPLADNVEPSAVTSALDPALTDGINIREDGARSALIIRAPASRHALLREAIADILAKLPEKKRTYSHVYRFAHAEPEAARVALVALLPHVTFAVDSSSRSLIATAGPSDHQKIQETIEQLDQQGQARQSRVYHLRAANPLTAQAVLQALLPRATFAVDAGTRTLAVTGLPNEQATVADMVKQLEATDWSTRSTQVYSLRNADPLAAVAVLQPAFAGVTIVPDTGRGLLLATATTEEHARIKDAVGQLDGNPADVSLRVYRVKHASSQTAHDALTRIYGRDPSVQITLDVENRAVVVRASAREHERIAGFIEQIDQADLDRDTTVESYALIDADTRSVVNALQTLFAGVNPQPKLSADRRGNQVVAVATPEQHALIRSTVKRMQGEAKELEVYSLRMNDPTAIEEVLAHMFEDSPQAPSISADPATQQLLVRGTKQEHETVRKLLIKMGESDLQTDQTDATVRVLPFSGDVQEVLQKLNQMWPSLHSNPLRILPNPASERAPFESPANGGPSNGADPAAGSKVDPADGSALHSAGVRDPIIAHALAGKKNRRVAFHDTENTTSGELPEQPDTGAAQQKPQVFVIPGEGRITIASEDKEALAEFERLLRAFSSSSLSGAAGANFDVFSLRNAGAGQVANLFRELIQRMPEESDSPLKRISVAPDERLNALVVHGSRADRAMFAGLMRILDSTRIPEFLGTHRPEIVKVLHASAADVVFVLRSIYKPQLTSGGNRPPVEIPKGVSTEVAAVLQQINASAGGPLLTLEVDEVTNSIVMIGPQELREEVSRLIEQLDHAASVDDKRRVEVLQLKSTSTKGLSEGLQFLLNRPQRSARTTR